MKGRLFVLTVCFFLLTSLSVEAGVTWKQAIRSGCYTSDQVKAIFDDGYKNIETMSVTYRNLTRYFPTFTDREVTKEKVNVSDTWVFRGYGHETTMDWHVKKLQEGILYSKAQNRLDKIIDKGGDVNEFWKTNGPKLEAKDYEIRNATFFMMRLLAIKSSDTPPSQFVSVALSFDVAKRFGAVVYAFQVNPDSPVLGLDGCQLGGEDQFQIFGGTRIQNLHRKRWASSDKWEKYDASKGQWASVDYDISSN